MTRLSREEQTEIKRPQRIPVSQANRDRLKVAGIDQENFMHRWVNDSEGRLQAFLDGGWEFVDSLGKPVGQGVDATAGTSSKFSKGVGRGVIAYLMRIPKEFWLEDQDAKERELKAREAENIRAARQNADYGRVTHDVKRTA